jgi:hypothetical protein
MPTVIGPEIMRRVKIERREATREAPIKSPMLSLKRLKPSFMG